MVSKTNQQLFRIRLTGKNQLQYNEINELLPVKLVLLKTKDTSKCARNREKEENRLGRNDKLFP